MIPDNPDMLLRRKATAETLNALGIPTSESTLATQAVRGGGPPFRRFGNIPLYRWGDVLSWVETKMSAPHANTSEEAAAGAHERQAAGRRGVVRNEARTEADHQAAA